MKEARESVMKELMSFVNGIERDYEAVRAGVTHIWNQGPVERPSTKSKRTNGSCMDEQVSLSSAKNASPKSFMSRESIGLDTLEQCSQMHPNLRRTQQLMQQFLHMLRERRGEERDHWLRAAFHSGIPE